jgi:hypothetical protein
MWKREREMHWLVSGGSRLVTSNLFGSIMGLGTMEKIVEGAEGD